MNEATQNPFCSAAISEGAVSASHSRGGARLKLGAQSADDEGSRHASVSCCGSSRVLNAELTLILSSLLPLR